MSCVRRVLMPYSSQFLQSSQFNSVQFQNFFPRMITVVLFGWVNWTLVIAQIQFYHDVISVVHKWVRRILNVPSTFQKIIIGLPTLHFHTPLSPKLSLSLPFKKIKPLLITFQFNKEALASELKEREAY